MVNSIAYFNNFVATKYQISENYGWKHAKFDFNELFGLFASHL